MARPMPRLPPVTRAVRSWSALMMPSLRPCQLAPLRRSVTLRRPALLGPAAEPGGVRPQVADQPLVALGPGRVAVAQVVAGQRELGRHGLRAVQLAPALERRRVASLPHQL